MKTNFYIQGENVLNAAKMFEQNNQSEPRREPVRSKVQHFIYSSEKLRERERNYKEL